MISKMTLNTVLWVKGYIERFITCYLFSAIDYMTQNKKRDKILPFY